MTTPQIAFVKSSLYQDLWVCDITRDPLTLFRTSLMRCPAIGLADAYQADFIVVREDPGTESLRHLNCIDKSHYHNLQHANVNKNPELPFLDETYHSDRSIDSVSHNVDEIDWTKYNIVITMNACVPERIVRAHPRILWCYFIGENKQYMIEPIHGYHVILNQDVTYRQRSPKIIGFPYTCLSPFLLEKMYYSLFEKTAASHAKDGIYMEINNTEERPVITIPSIFQHIARECHEMTIRLHSQNIVTNLKRVCESKYFVKLTGRVVRGNSIVECVSAGTLILANRRLVIFNDLIDERCHCETYADVISKIHFFERNPEEYKKVVFYQRQQLNTHYFKGPIQKLFQKYQELIQSS